MTADLYAAAREEPLAIDRLRCGQCGDDLTPAEIIGHLAAEGRTLEPPWECDWKPDELNPGLLDGSPGCPYCAGEMCGRFDGLGCTHDRIERHGYGAEAPADPTADQEKRAKWRANERADKYLGLAEEALTPTGDHHRLPSGYCLDCAGQHIGDWLAALTDPATDGGVK